MMKCSEVGYYELLHETWNAVIKCTHFAPMHRREYIVYIVRTTISKLNVLG